MVYAPDDAEERLLHHVLRRLPGRHVHPGNSQHRVVVAVDQRGERALVTAAQRVDERVVATALVVCPQARIVSAHARRRRYCAAAVSETLWAGSQLGATPQRVASLGPATGRASAAHASCGLSTDGPVTRCYTRHPRIVARSRARVR